jgi:hypothetical protein
MGALTSPANAYHFQVILIRERAEAPTERGCGTTAAVPVIGNEAPRS